MGVKFDWQSGDPRFTLLEAEPARGRRDRRHWLLAGAAVLLVIAGLSWLVQQGLRAARADLQRQIEQEITALRAGQRTVFLALLDDSQRAWKRYHEQNFLREAAWYAAHRQAKVRIESLDLGPDRATVSILLSDGVQSRRATWFFKRREGIWRHTAPPSEAWSSTCRITTPHITLVAPAGAREATIRLAWELEGFYSELAKTYHLNLSGNVGVYPPGGHISIRILPYAESEHGEVRWSFSLPAPEIALEMWTSEEREAFLRTAARAAVARTLLGSTWQQPLPAGGQGLLESLALWLASAWQPEWQSCLRESLADGTWQRFLDGWEAQPSEGAERPQALAYALGEFLGRACTADQLAALVREAGVYGSSWSAILHVLGWSRPELETMWGDYLRQRYGR